MKRILQILAALTIVGAGSLKAGAGDPITFDPVPPTCPHPSGGGKPIGIY